MRLLRFSARTHRTFIVGWTLLLCALPTITARSYQSSYPSTAARHAAADLARQNPATTAMYGRLGFPGTSVQFFTWEMGAFLAILAAIMGVLLAIACTRGPEDAGTAEILRASGIAPLAPLRTSITLLTIVAGLLAVTTGGAIGLGTRGTEGAAWPGAWALGSVIGLTFLLLALITAVIAQVLPTAVSSRSAAFSALGLFFVLRAVADAKDISWLNALTPLGLRALTAPFAGNHWGPLAAAGVACAGLASIALGLSARRDLGGGLLHPPARSARRLAVRSVLGLQRRLVGGSTVAWTLGIACGSAAFIALGSSAVTATREGHISSGFLGTQIGTADPAAGYLGYTGTIIGIVAGVYAVLIVLGLAADETAGRAAQVLATGASRARLLMATLAASALGTLLILALTASAAALVAPRILDGHRVAGQAFTQVIGQWPAMLALAGLTGLAVGAGPRWRHLAWLPLALSAFLALLGKLLKFPQAVIDLGLFQHVPRLGSGGPPWPLAVLVALAALSAAGGLRCFLARDLANG